MRNAMKSGDGRMTARRAYSAALKICRQAGRLSSAGTHPDEKLLEACARYGRIRRRIDRLAAGSARIDDDGERARAYADLTDVGRLALLASLSAAATTLEGHRARAALFLAWDEGELVGRARREQMLEDRLLAALLLDLVAARAKLSVPGHKANEAGQV